MKQTILDIITKKLIPTKIYRKEILNKFTIEIEDTKGLTTFFYPSEDKRNKDFYLLENKVFYLLTFNPYVLIT